MTNDYKVTFIDKNGNKDNWCTLAGSIATAIAYTERFQPIEILSVEKIGGSAPEDAEIVKAYRDSRDAEG